MSWPRLVVLGLWLLMSNLHVSADERLPDVRFLIDVSGSMKQSDPSNLRQPALELLLRLLPENAQAGVWTFGRGVNMVVPHGRVDDAWREQAASAVGQINNHGLFTNIPDALELATFDVERLSDRYRTSVILLTDGKVDIEGDSERSQRAAAHLLGQVSFELRQYGIPVHTIALSDQADWDFLQRLAQGTGGLAEKAESADDLSRVLLQALDIAAPLDQVPLLGGEFLIDASVDEFTVLVLPEQADDPLELLSPTASVSSEAEPGAGESWYSGRGFSLITVTSPASGRWRVRAPGAIARVHVLSDLRLQLDGLDTSMPAGREPELGVSLQADQVTVTDPEPLGLLNISVQISRDDGESWTVTTADADIPASGEYRLWLPMLSEPGRYQLDLTLDGGSFQRQAQLLTDVLKPRPKPSPPMPAAAPEPEPLVEASLWPLNGSAVLLLLLLGWWFIQRRGKQPVANPATDHDDELLEGIRTDADSR